MKNLILLFSLFSLSTAIAAPRVSDHQVAPYRSGYRNYVKNPSAQRNTANTSTTSASLSRDTTSGYKLDGFASFSCNASATDGYCEWTLDTIENPDDSGNCAFTGEMNGDGSLYSARITDGSGNTLNTVSLGNVSSWTPFEVTYPCGSSRKIRIVQTTAGTSPAINVGHLNYGRWTGGGSAPVVGAWSSSPAPGGSITNGSRASYFQRQVGGNIEIQVGVSFTGASTLEFASAAIVPNGLSIDTGRFSYANTSIAAVGKFYAYDTGTADYAGTVYYNSSTSKFTLVNEVAALPFTPGNGDSAQLSVSVPIQGWLSSVAGFRANTDPLSWSGTQIGSGGGWSTTSTAFADFSVATTNNVVTQLTSTNLTCVAESTKLPAVTCTFPRAGTYAVSVTGSLTNPSTSAAYVRLVDGSGTVINGGVRGGGTTDQRSPFNLSGRYSAAAAGSVTFKLQGITGNSSNATSLGEESETPLTWVVESADQKIAAPVVIGGVTSNSTAAIREEWAQLTCGNSGSAIVIQPPTWLASVSNGASVGQCSATLTEAWANPVSCTCSSDSTARSCVANVSGTTMTVRHYNSDGSGSAENGTANISCRSVR